MILAIYIFVPLRRTLTSFFSFILPRNWGLRVCALVYMSTECFVSCQVSGIGIGLGITITHNAIPVELTALCAHYSYIYDPHVLVPKCLFAGVRTVHTLYIVYI